MVASTPTERVALFLPSLEGGGAERVMLTLARGFARRGLSVDVVVVQATGAYLDQVPGTVRLVDLGASRAARSLLALIRYLIRERPQALLSSSAHANVVALLAKRIAMVSTRAVVRQAEQVTLNGSSRTVSFLKRHLYRRADAVIASSQRMAHDLVRVTGVPPERIRVVPSPIVTAELFTLAHEPLSDPWFLRGAAPVVLSVGRLHQDKDFATLIRAFAAVRRHTPARLLILGEGPARPALEALVRELGLDGDVALPGFVRNPFAYMRRAELYVLSSRTEGLPGALIQALACGAPVIATDCRCGPREVLHDGRFGRLVPVGDVAGLAQAIRLALSRPRQAAPPEAWQPFCEQAAVDAHLRILAAGPLRIT